MQTGTTITDQLDILHEQVKLLAGEVALYTKSLEKLTKEAVDNPKDSQNEVPFVSFKL